jgi:hypothetical protein
MTETAPYPKLVVSAVALSTLTGFVGGAILSTYFLMRLCNG